MGTISQIQEKFRQVSGVAGGGGSTFDRGGGGGDDSGMEARILALEAANLETRDRLARIETRLDFVTTKADLHEALHSLTWKLIGSCALLVAATFAIAKLVH